MATITSNFSLDDLDATFNTSDINDALSLASDPLGALEAATGSGDQGLTSIIYMAMFGTAPVTGWSSTGFSGTISMNGQDYDVQIHGTGFSVLQSGALDTRDSTYNITAVTITAADGTTLNVNGNVPVANDTIKSITLNGLTYTASDGSTFVINGPVSYTDAAGYTAAKGLTWSTHTWIADGVNPGDGHFVDVNLVASGKVQMNFNAVPPVFNANITTFSYDDGEGHHLTIAGLKLDAHALANYLANPITDVQDLVSFVVTNGGTDTAAGIVSNNEDTSLQGYSVHNLTLGTGALNGTGNELANTITGNAGDNRLDGGANSAPGDHDTLKGGAGDDTYVIHSSTDVVTEVAGQGTDTVIVDPASAPGPSGSTFVLSANVENIILAGSYDLNATGNALANELTGNAGANTLMGGAGNDTLYGGDGTDHLEGGAGNDTYLFTYTQLVTDNDTVTEAAGAAGGNDTLIVTSQAADGSNGQTVSLDGRFANIENITLLGASDVNATGNAGANVLRGDGNTGANVLTGGDGNDTYYVGNGDTAVETNAVAKTGGVDIVYSSADSYTLGDNIENLTLVAGAGNIDGTGNGLANVITGNEGDNVLDGGDGVDKLVGGAGNDTYIVDLVTKGTGNAMTVALQDTITEAAAATGGVDTLVLSSGGATIALTKATTLTLAGGLENLDASHTFGTLLNLTGNAAANTITGNDAANVINGGAGADTMDGGDGGDTYYVDSADIAGVGTGVHDSGATGTDLAYFTGKAGETFDMRVYGVGVENATLQGALALNVTGNSLANTLTGNTGNNVLDGGANANPGDHDTLIGGKGNDTYVIHSANDVVTELAGQGTDTLVVSADVANLNTVDLTQAAYANIENVTLLGNSSRTVIGTNAANVFHAEGDIGANELQGGDGNDTYYVGNGDTVVETNAVAKTGGVDIVYSSASSFTLGANIENLTLVAGAGNIDGTGNDLANVITGNEGNNVLTGGGGADKLAGGLGDDTYIVNLVTKGTGANMTVALEDTITEAAKAGFDVVHLEGSQLNLTKATTLVLGANLEGMDASDTGKTLLNLTGNALDNFLVGNAADNVLSGGAGNDWLDGGSDGRDTLTGGAGNDTFVLDQTATTFVKVTDFVHGVDVLALLGGNTTSPQNAQLLGTVNSSAFVSGASVHTSAMLNGGVPVAADAGQHYLYDTTNGNLFYDADGSGAQEAVLIAQILNNGKAVADLSASDLHLFN